MTNRGDILQVRNFFKGQFLIEPAAIQEKLFRAKAFVFDWDGVFNNGMKNENGMSPFSEVDSLGISMLRFNYFLRHGKLPITAVITGETNDTTFALAKREHFDTVYYHIKNKKEALTHLCETHKISAHEVVCFFDDVLDLAIAESCGLRMMMGRVANPLLVSLVHDKGFADYITAADGDNYALREATELLIGLSGRFDDTIMQRVHFSDHYKQYLEQRNTTEPAFYSSVDAKIVSRKP